MHSHQWKRREVITLLGGAAATWPVWARAQPHERMRRIGVLLPASASDPEYPTLVGAFLQELQLGLVASLARGNYNNPHCL